MPESCCVRDVRARTRTDDVVCLGLNLSSLGWIYKFKRPKRNCRFTYETAQIVGHSFSNTVEVVCEVGLQPQRNFLPQMCLDRVPQGSK